MSHPGPFVNRMASPYGASPISPDILFWQHARPTIDIRDYTVCQHGRSSPRKSAVPSTASGSAGVN